MKTKILNWLPVGLMIVLAVVFSFSNRQEDLQERKVNVGDSAPEISLKDPSGKVYSLSDLKGKIVLVDFWASWCSPCRKENPSLVRTYERFHYAKFKNAKEFVIFSVSLDDDTNRWKQAIEKDQLSWEYHVSDLKGWNSEAAAAYGVESIPSNFLIDHNGKVIAINLKGKSIDDALKALQ